VQLSLASPTLRSRSTIAWTRLKNCGSQNSRPQVSTTYPVLGAMSTSVIGGLIETTTSIADVGGAIANTIAATIGNTIAIGGTVETTTATGIGARETTVATAGATGTMIAAMGTTPAAGTVATMIGTASGGEETTGAAVAIGGTTAKGATSAASPMRTIVYRRARVSCCEAGAG
jgi:hypothetical protein